jgi:hypothetical protein
MKTCTEDIVQILMCVYSVYAVMNAVWR